jgi:hypothetical protein
MSIPHAMDAKLWSLFTLAHFKPFSAASPLLSEDEDAIEVFRTYVFSPCSRTIMSNWEAVHECEDERDADRLKKQAKATAESKALSLSLGVMGDNDEIELNSEQNHPWRCEEDFHIQQVVLLLQQSRWIRASKEHGETPHSTDLPPSCRNEYQFGDLGHLCECLKRWKTDIKRQENVVTDSQRNALNPECQIACPVPATDPAVTI